MRTYYHLTHFTDGHRRPRHLHRPDAASVRGRGREHRQSHRAPRRGRGRRHPGQRRGASADDDALFESGTLSAFVARAARSGPRLVRTRDRGIATDHRTSIASIGVRESPAIPRRAPRRDAESPPIYARAFVGRRALFPDTFPPGASPRRPARVPDLTSRLTNPPHANHSPCSRFAELRQDRRDDRRLERLHRDPQSDGARSFAAEPEGCGRRHRRHDRRRAQARLRPRLRTSPTRSDGPFPLAASSPSPHPAASPRSHPW